MAKYRIPDGSARGPERQAGSLSYIALGRLCGGGGDTFRWLHFFLKLQSKAGTPYLLDEIS
jgi:hypothetical protein